MNKTVLVSGGAGFIGSHLCEALIAANSHVYCLDNLFTGSMDNIQPLLHLPNFDFIHQDVIEQFDIVGEIHEIYNLASPASPVHYQKDPVLTWKTNIYGTHNVLDLALSKGACLVQASTSEIYGSPQVHPQTEDYWGNVNPIGVRACYDESKRAAETLCYDYKRQYGLDVRVARIFNTFGPNMAIHDGRVVSNFINQMINHQPITLYGQGKQTRSFCYVSDLVNGLMGLMSCEAPLPGPINLGNPHEVSVSQLAKIIGELMNVEPLIHYYPLPQDDPHCRQPDIGLAKTQLDWQPMVSLNEGLLKTVDYFKQHHERQKGVKATDTKQL